MTLQEIIQMLSPARQPPAVQRAAPTLADFGRRMDILNSLPQSTTGPEVMTLARMINPGMKLSINPNYGPGEGTWHPQTGMVLPPPETALRGTPEHEFAHELQYQTGIGTADLGRGSGPYANYGRVPRRIVEAAADVASGTRGYLPDLPVEERSQAKALADMLLAAGREMAQRRQ